MKFNIYIPSVYKTKPSDLQQIFGKLKSKRIINFIHVLSYNKKIVGVYFFNTPNDFIALVTNISKET